MSAAFSLLRSPELNFLAALDKKERVTLRKVCRLTAYQNSEVAEVAEVAKVAVTLQVARVLLRVPHARRVQPKLVGAKRPQLLRSHKVPYPLCRR